MKHEMRKSAAHHAKLNMFIFSPLITQWKEKSVVFIKALDSLGQTQVHKEVQKVTVPISVYTIFLQVARCYAAGTAEGHPV